ncbi:NAD-dependent epimerase/dehydratase family protein [Gallaecimonas pentaromativorans]|uniref:UDP-glucose 4-epimerase n=1 Tax=Gallaecimonas pentaromativorans TaxID=584787 RepID=A0A3N1P4Y1_9GAMM|nr:NAD(P)-dependent oxidoreductase [Gallaecimonas pentaromativorans]ROQ22531.1 UDP-glucose 4-epimerase [Gallaecimonas pentaromativorans]
MSNVLITGCFGFIGSALMKKLRLEGHRVLGVGRGILPAEEGKGDDYICGDLNSTFLASFYAKHDFKPDYVFHLAGSASVARAEASPSESLENNVVTTLRLLEWVRCYCPSAKVIFSSSAAVYGSNESNSLLKESNIPCPVSTYGQHKIFAEDIALSYASRSELDVRIARLFSVYGPGLKKQFLWDFCNRVSENQSSYLEMFGSGDELRDWIFIDDLVSMLWNFAQNDNCQVVMNIGTGVANTVKGLAELILNEFGRSDIRLDFNGNKRIGDPVSLVADVSRQSCLNFPCQVDLATGVKHYVQWFLNER